MNDKRSLQIASEVILTASVAAVALAALFGAFPPRAPQQKKQAQTETSSRTQTNRSSPPQSTASTSAQNDWLTYRNDQLKYEVKYPPSWLQRKGSNDPTSTSIYFQSKDYLLTLGFISPLQRAMMGASPPCDACEAMEVAGARVLVRLEENRLFAEIPHPSYPEGGSVTLELKPVSQETKTFLRLILSTFRYLKK